MLLLLLFGVVAVYVHRCIVVGDRVADSVYTVSDAFAEAVSVGVRIRCVTVVV